MSESKSQFNCPCCKTPLRLIDETQSAGTGVTLYCPWGPCPWPESNDGATATTEAEAYRLLGERYDKWSPTEDA